MKKLHPPFFFWKISLIVRYVMFRQCAEAPSNCRNTAKALQIFLPTSVACILFLVGLLQCSCFRAACLSDVSNIDSMPSFIIIIYFMRINNNYWYHSYTSCCMYEYIYGSHKRHEHQTLGIKRWVISMPTMHTPALRVLQAIFYLLSQAQFYNL